MRTASGTPSLQQLDTATDKQLAVEPDEPPVVARMIVEIRSDGTRTVARGALEDVATGNRVALVARGNSPAQLAASLARSLLKAPVLAGAKFSALLLGGRRKRRLG